MHSHEPAEVIKPPLQTEQGKAPLPNSALALQAVSQLHAVSFICFFQIGFLFNRRKAFILMTPLGLSPGRRATPDSCGMGRDGTGWDRMGQGGWGAPLCMQTTANIRTFQPLLPFSKAQRSRGKFAFLPFLNPGIPGQFPKRGEQCRVFAVGETREKNLQNSCLITTVSRQWFYNSIISLN